ncbi:type IV secretory system conjugative DNA transfer family protein [Streptosporangium saharense]|uniref:Type IV secretory pathway TraG/TraD family ATPase VirD4 n=1 Tax=Streptosporangium saharense TaxID=1706840 RepID=A0A7W7QW72_9ACTN|nr:type IV secretory system conjugative DNA transfer family protein [Streptosporangium saharense]MBB4920882.1 type IV secretory pathway TraG/TraD family ATPase VirD4 [Streptosporangium saharense]
MSKEMSPVPVNASQLSPVSRPVPMLAATLPALAAAAPMPWDLVPGWAWVVLAGGAAGMGALSRIGRTPRMPRLSLRRRLQLRVLRPGPGYAGLWELYRGYSPRRARAVARRSRPSLSLRDRWLGPPAAYAVYLGRARPWGRKAYATLKDVTLTIAPPQQGKSAAAVGRVLDAPGPVIVTSIRGDLISMTAGVRQQYGHLHVFNPGGIGDWGTTLRWNLVAGCQDPDTAIRRAGYLVAGMSASAVTDASFWSDQAVLTLAGYLHAGALARVTLRTVHEWIVSRDEVALRVLEGHEGAYPEARLAVAEYLGLPERTQASVATTIRGCLRFLSNPSAAASVEPRTRGDLFDVDQFLSGRDTLYLVASADAAELAPLFLTFVAEIFHRAVGEGSRARASALDPPLTLVLDEVANICPIPVHSWVTYAAGSGVVLHLIGQAWSHFKARWGEHGAETIWQAATCKILYTASSDVEMMERVSRLAGEVRVQTGVERISEGRDAKGQAQHRTRPTYERVPVLPPSAMRQLPPWHAVVILADRQPTIVQVERGWLRPDYKEWAKSGRAIQLPGVTTAWPVPEPRPELARAGRPADEIASRRERRVVAPEEAQPLPLASPDEQGGSGGDWRPWGTGDGQ